MIQHDSAAGGRVVRRQQVMLTRSGEDALLVDEQGGNVHVVNRTGARLWELCDGDPTVESLTESFAHAYGLGSDEVRADVERILATFEEVGLVDIDRQG